MKEIAIPLFIPLKNNEIDYQSLKNLINEINDYNILIGDYNLNNLSDEDYLNVYLYINIINPNNKYYLNKNRNDSLINNVSKEYYILPLGNVFPSEIKEYIINKKLDVKDNTLIEYLELFNNIIKNDKNKIEYILIKKKIINKSNYVNIDNLLGINEI
jgi:hypothetical protein